ALTDDDAGAKRLRCLLQSGGDVHYVAEDRIVEALRRPDISDNAFTCVQAYANAYRNEALALQPAFFHQLGIEPRDIIHHRKSGTAGVFGMPSVFQRS